MGIRHQRRPHPTRPLTDRRTYSGRLRWVLQLQLNFFKIFILLLQVFNAKSINDAVQEKAHCFSFVHRGPWCAVGNVHCDPVEMELGDLGDRVDY